MICAERACSRTFSTQYQWSPALSAAVNSVRYWRLRIRQAKCAAISQYTLQKQMEEAQITARQNLYTPSIV